MPKFTQLFHGRARHKAKADQLQIQCFSQHALGPAASPAL